MTTYNTHTKELNILDIRERFPILNEKVYGKPLVYLDNAATTQKPLDVIRTLDHYYLSLNSNIHRGVHHLSQLATSAYEESRNKVCNFINANDSCEVIFTKGTTESINIIARCLGDTILGPNSGIALSTMEHHSNMVPWQEAAKRKNAPIYYIRFDKDGNLLEQDIEDILSKNPAILSITHASNVLGTINPIKKIIKAAHKRGILVLIDGAQAVAHTQVDVQDLDCDFYCFSGHKMYAPMGIGVLYGKKELLEKLPPYQFGGEMIEEVSLKGSTFNKLPFKFEAGTPPVAEALALSTAIDFLNDLGLKNIAMHEQKLLERASHALLDIGGIEIYGNSPHKTGLISFNIIGAHHYDVGTIVDQMGVAVRTGHHCAQPLIEEIGLTGTVRASFAIYNTDEEIDYFVQAIKKAKQMLL